MKTERLKPTVRFIRDYSLDDMGDDLITIIGLAVLLFWVARSLGILDWWVLT